MSTVALVRCNSYQDEEVDTAVRRGLILLGGVERFVRPGESIVLKPNLLVGREAERAVTTHPSVFRAVAQALSSAGARLLYGDSPGFGRTEGVAGRAGIARAASELAIPAADFGSGETVSFPDGHLIKQFTIAHGVLDADGLVSIAKLKTHGLTRITGAIKNQFGCIPGALKAEFHARLPNADLFSQMLVDLNLLLRPRLFVVDGIVAMEGNGPQNGRPRPMNTILLSNDPVALDATICRLIDLDPRLVPPIAYGEAFGLGSAKAIDIVGDPIASFVVPDFDVNRSPRATAGRPGHVSRIARRLIVPRPVIRPEACTQCGTCVRVCPVTPKAVEFKTSGSPPVHHYDRCIRCYCCQELCPEGAIEIEVPPLGRLIHR
ncbi:MAG: DUF362 domain-containing protein [Candidatus Bipolaricaulota bacterium]|nr:DUF362 domain-containing protein [Candidatus Bipolaricaulota bacterium]